MHNHNESAEKDLKKENNIKLKKKMRLKDLETKLMSGLFSFEDLKKDGFKMMEITYRTSIFYGQVKEFEDGRCHKEGKGVLLYENGRVYEGNWKNNKREGVGYERFQSNSQEQTEDAQDCDIYQGEYMMGRAHGRGVYIWSNGETYDGEWYKGMRQGKGIWKGTNTQYYDGEWSKGKAHGFGVHLWSNGDKYDGEWYRSLKHGKGKDFFHNGDTYHGEYRYGKFEGIGTYKYAKGAMYVGQFKDGTKHGKGEWQEKEDGGATYEGEYLDDKKHGIGIYKWPSGNEYRGNYVNDKREGYGEMYWTDGSFYKGEWKEGIQNGKGKMTFSDGSIREGQFVNNMYVDSKNYQYTIDQEDQDDLLNRSAYSHMPRAIFTAMNDRDRSYGENPSDHQRRYSNADNIRNSHTLSFQNIANQKLMPKRENSMDQVNERFEYEEESRNVSRLMNPYKNEQEEYDSDYMGPRKPYMREDRSTSPPTKDPMFRGDRFRSVGIQETSASVVLPKIHQKKSDKKPKIKKSSPAKLNNRFLKKYPQLFKGVRRRGGGARKEKSGRMLKVSYKPWIPSSVKYSYFDDIAHKYKIY